jgi:hypothetical protein
VRYTVADTVPNDHLDPNAVAAYVAGRLKADERSWIERHLADCPECVSEIVAIHRTERPRRRFAPVVAGGLVAAAAVVAIWVGSTGRVPQTPADDIRGPGGPSVLQLEAVRPADGSTMDDAGFIWRAMANAVTYRLTVTDEAGDEIWNQTTSDTTLRPSPEVTLAPGRTYFWYVDALRSDGVSATSGVRSFRIGE